MSVAISSALNGIMTEFTTLFEGMSVELSAAAAAAAPVAAIGGVLAAAIAFGEAFTKEWNKERAQIPNVEANLSSAIGRTTTLGTSLANQRREFENFKDEILAEQELSNQIFDTNINIQKLIDLNKKLDDKLIQQVKDWVANLALVQTAGDDNTFYTLHRDDVDKIISVWNSRQDSVDSLLKAAYEFIKTIQTTFNYIKEAYQTSLGVITFTEAATKSDEPTLEQLMDAVEKGYIQGRLAEIILKISRSLVRTRTKTKQAKKKQAKKKRRNKRKQPKPKKGKKKTPQTIRVITAEVGNKSAWIQKLVFTFPENEPIDSDRAGTLMVYLKKGNPIKFVRVKRGTFSVIAMWSLGMSFGTGFRIWSQFWKKRIVNVGKVFSWFIPRINKLDREIGIKIEIAEKKVKYK